MIRIRVGRRPDIVAVALLFSTGNYDAVKAYDFDRGSAHTASQNGIVLRGLLVAGTGAFTGFGIRSLRDERSHHQQCDEKCKKPFCCDFSLHLSFLPIRYGTSQKCGTYRK